MIELIGLIASIIAIVGLAPNLYSICFNIKHFRKGAVRVTFLSNEYKIITVDNTTRKEKVIYQSSSNRLDYMVYRENGKIEHHEKIPPFFKWNFTHWKDDIREPNYPISLLY